MNTHASFMNNLVDDQAGGNDSILSYFFSSLMQHQVPVAPAWSPKDLNTLHFEWNLTDKKEGKGLNNLHFQWNFFVYAHMYVNTYMYIEQQQQQQQQQQTKKVQYGGSCNTCVLHYIDSREVSFW